MMPIYVYRIRGTDECVEQFQRITDKPFKTLRLKGGKRRRVERVPQRVGAQTDYAEPLRMTSVGVDPGHIPEARRQSPSSEFDPVTGEAIFRSRSHLKKCRKERGLVEGGRC